MEMRERRHEDSAAPQGPQAGGAGGQGAGLEALRNTGQGFLAAADDAIRRALSPGRSEAFLAASRQEGGE